MEEHTTERAASTYLRSRSRKRYSIKHDVQWSLKGTPSVSRLVDEGVAISQRHKICSGA